jgi:hypothetical protein
MIPYLRHFSLPLTTHRFARYSAHLFPRPGWGLQWFVGPDPRPPLYPIRLVGPGPPAFLISLIYGKISHFDTNCVGYKGNHSLGLNPFVNLRSANLPGLPSVQCRLYRLRFGPFKQSNPFFYAFCFPLSDFVAEFPHRRTPPSSHILLYGLSF